MLDRCQPAFLHGLGGGCLGNILDVKLFVLAAVVDDRPVKGVAVDIEHRALGRCIGALELEVVGSAVGRCAFVVHGVFEVDLETVAVKAKGLFHPQGRVRALPAERYDQFIGALGQYKLGTRCGVFGEVVRFGLLVCCTQTTLYRIEGFGLTAQQLQRHIGPILVHRVGRQLCRAQVAAAQINLDLEYAGAHGDQPGSCRGCGLGRRFGKVRDRLGSTWQARQTICGRR
jgi:hypothetical protein